jgi:cephalosporin hydroxylase
MDNSVQFSTQSICDGHHNVLYRDVKYIRCPFDYVIYQMIINEIKPDLIIEVGTNAGGGALYMADIMNSIGHGEVHTIDIVDMVKSELVKSHPRIKRFLGGYQSYDLKNSENFNTVIVIDDGSHTYEDVKKSLEKFKDIPTKNSYFIVEDGIINELGYPNYNGGPLKAIEEFLSDNKNYEIDRKWCDFFGKNATFNINGYLKKIN